MSMDLQRDMERPSKAVRLEERGFSLIEVMIAMVISVLVVGSGYTVLYTQSRMSNMNRQVVQTQQNVRVAMELMTQDLRAAGFGMNGAVGACNTAIVPADNNPTGDDTGPDAVSLVVPTAISTLWAGTSPSFNKITLQPGDIAAVTPDGFGAGSAISINGTVSGSVQSIATDVITLTSTVGAPATFPVGAQVYWLRCIPYAVSTVAATCGGVAPCLLRNGVALADGIEDLQLAYACDGCDGSVEDGVIDDQDASNNFTTGDFIPNDALPGSVVADPSTIRVVRVSIVARQTQLDQRSEGGALAMSSPTFLEVEDHDHEDDGVGIATYQQFRRRLYTRTVQVRNMGLDS